jgi:hypothetical protein
MSGETLLIGEVERDGRARTRRVLISHEEVTLLVVRRPACVPARRVAALLGAGQPSSVCMSLHTRIIGR